MTSPLDRILNRRTVLAGVPFVGVGLWSQRPRVSAQMQMSGDCTLEPAVQYLRDYATMNLQALPADKMGMTFEPGVDWEIAQSAELGILMIPPGWTLVNVWANSVDSDGMPEWQQNQPQFPFWAATIIISPDESAMFMYVYGGVDDVALSPADGADLARQLVMGTEDQPNNICQIEQVNPPSTQQSAAFLTGERYESNLMVSKGDLLISSVSGMNLEYGTTFMIDAFVAPASEAEDLVLNVYLKILYQLIPKGGESEPTPTPTPSF